MDMELELVLRPALKGAFFTSHKKPVEFFSLDGKRVAMDLPAHTYAFNFMGRTLVVYHNAMHKDTFGVDKVEIRDMVLHYAGRKTRQIAGGGIPSPLAQDVREGRVIRIDATLA